MLVGRGLSGPYFAREIENARRAIESTSLRAFFVRTS
jgi:hypothetical protein